MHTVAILLVQHRLVSGYAAIVKAKQQQQKHAPISIGYVNK
jgi:hypothetical protein